MWPRLYQRSEGFPLERILSRRAAHPPGIDRRDRAVDVVIPVAAVPREPHVRADTHAGRRRESGATTSLVDQTRLDVRESCAMRRPSHVQSVGASPLSRARPFPFTSSLGGLSNTRRIQPVCNAWVSGSGLFRTRFQARLGERLWEPIGPRKGAGRHFLTQPASKRSEDPAFRPENPRPGSKWEWSGTPPKLDRQIPVRTGQTTRWPRSGSLDPPADLETVESIRRATSESPGAPAVRAR